MALQGVLLDIDGTLLLSNTAHAQSWVDAFAEFGYQVSLPQAQGLIGMGGDRVIPILAPGLTDTEDPGKAIAQRRGEIFMSRYSDGVEPAPGARALLQRMREDGLALIVASSAKQAELTDLLNRAIVADLIDVTTTSDDAEESKPAPDIVQVALRKSGLEPQQVLMLGDTPYDVEAARNGGVGIIALRCGGHSDANLSDALAIYDDPADLLAHYDESPLGQAVAQRA